jgi:Cu/Ag efflux pump CusA
MRGASERPPPILMTAAVTALRLLPLAIGSGTAGREIEGPMAIIIIGGHFYRPQSARTSLTRAALWTIREADHAVKTF